MTEDEMIMHACDKGFVSRKYVSQRMSQKYLGYTPLEMEIMEAQITKDFMSSMEADTDCDDGDSAANAGSVGHQVFKQMQSPGAWPTISNGSNSNTTGAGTVTPSGGVQISGSTAGSAYAYTSPTMSISVSVQQKSKIAYIIQSVDGSRIQLLEQPQMTPREMLGISKFLSLVSVFANNSSLYNSYSIQWSELIKELSIEKHFVDATSQVYDAEVFTIILYNT